MFTKLKKTLGIATENSVNPNEIINDTLELTYSDLFKIGGNFPPVTHRERLDRYERNRDIFKGEHFEKLRDFKGSVQHQDLLYVSTNLAGVVCKKNADFLFGEPIQVLSGKEENSEEQKALDRFVEENNIDIQTYESALSNAYRGDAFFKIRYGQEFGGELPDTIDEKRVVIEPIAAESVFPETSLYNRNKIYAYHIAVPQKVSIEGKEAWQLFVESHYAGRIEERVYNLIPKETRYQGSYGEVVLWKIEGEVLNGRNIIYTGATMPLVVHIPNYATDDTWEGIDDITEHIPVLEEINNRLTQISDILNKHADPMLSVPAGILGEDETGQPIFQVQRDKVVEVMGKEDIIPEYITWEGQLSHAFTELETLVDLFLTTAEIPAVALGRGDSGTSGSSGLAIKWRMNSLLAKVNRKRQYYNRGLKQIFVLAQQLEKSVNKAKYEPFVPRIVFQDGLPDDDTEQATVMSIRTNGMKTLSQKTAIMRLENMTEEQAELELKRIEEEDKKAQELITKADSVFNKPMRKDIDKNDTKKHAEGNPVTDKAKEKK